jgi:hypothetical protein
MGIDYIIDLDCEPKRALGVANIVQRVKSRERGTAALEAALAAGDTRPPAELSIETVVRGKIERVERTTAQALLDRAAPLEAHADRCVPCRANRGAHAGYGCYRSIPYPIPVVAEEWLLMRLPDNLHSTAGWMLKSALDDFKWDGTPTAELRARSRTFFESDSPSRVEWGDVSVSADQLFQMLFLVGSLEPSHAMMMALFLGVLPHDSKPSDLENPTRRDRLAARATIPPVDPAIEPLADFLRALPVAVGLGVRVLVDA